MPRTVQQRLYGKQPCRLTSLATQTQRPTDHPKGARLKVSDLRALLLESGRHGQQAGGSGDSVQQLATKYGVSAQLLLNVLKYNQLPGRSDSSGSEPDRLGFRSEETST